MTEYKKGQVWKKPLTPEMEEFERYKDKHAVYAGKITGQFEAWMNKYKGKAITTDYIQIKSYVELMNIKSVPSGYEVDIYVNGFQVGDRVIIKTSSLTKLKKQVNERIFKGLFEDVFGGRIG